MLNLIHNASSIRLFFANISHKNISVRAVNEFSAEKVEGDNSSDDDDDDWSDDEQSDIDKEEKKEEGACCLDYNSR